MIDPIIVVPLFMYNCEQYKSVTSRKLNGITPGCKNPKALQ